MNCAQCQDLVQLQLDGVALAEPAELDLHLASCPDCRGLQNAAGCLQQGLRLLAAPRPHDLLADQIIGRLRQEWGNQRRRRRILVFTAAAATIAVVLAARLLWFPAAPLETLRQQGEPLVQHTGAAKPVQPEGADMPSVGESVSEMGSVMLSAAARTADATVAQSRAFLPLVPSAPLPDLQLPAMEPPVLGLREAGQGVSDGLAPVAESAKRAYDLFLRDLPPMSLDGKPGL